VSDSPTELRTLTPEDEPLVQAAMDALDTLEPLVPRGWRHATVELERAGELLRLRRVAARFEGASAPVEPYPDLGFSSPEWMAAVGSAFTRLRQYLLEDGITWDGVSARCEREELTRGRVTLLDRDGRPAIDIPIGEDIASGQLVNAELLRIFEESSEEWGQRQEELQEDIHGFRRWEYDEAGGVLVFESPGLGREEFPALLLGSYSNVQHSWCWAWANRSYQELDHARLLQVREEALEYEGLGALCRGGFFCDEEFAFNVALLAADDLGGSGVFVGRPRPDLFLYYCVLEESGLEDEQEEGAGDGALHLRVLRFGRTFTGAFELELSRYEAAGLLETLEHRLTTREPLEVSGHSFDARFEPSDSPGYEIKKGILVVRFTRAVLDEAHAALRESDDGAARELPSLPGLGLRWVAI
jgi:hypothetical protein